MGNSRNGCSLQLGINLNSGATTKEVTGTRCAVKVGFVKRVKQEKIWREPPQKGNGWSGGDRLLLLYKICWKTKMGPQRISALHPQIQPKFGLAKILKLTDKTNHVNYQMQQNKVVHPTPMFKS